MAFLLYLHIASLAFQFICKIARQKITAQIHRLTYQSSLNPKTVVIIGGSFSGVHLANLLSNSIPTGYRVVLVEKNTHMHYCFAFPRFCVLGGHERKAFIPYDGMVGRAPKGVLSIVHETVTKIRENEIVLSSNEKIPYHYLVIATGVSQAAPARLLATDREDGEGELKSYQKAIRASGKIAVIGGGAVGVELAMDIKSYLPDKEVTLIHSRDRLLVRFGAQLHEVVFKKMQELGVKVLFNERPAIPIPDNGKPFMSEKTEIVFKNGQTEMFDLVISCTGQNPNSSILKTSLPNAITDDGFIRVAPTLQVEGEDINSRNIFAIGDVAATNGPKMAFAGMAQAEIACSNILNLIRGKEHKLRPYKPNYLMEGRTKLSLGKGCGLLFMEDKNDYLVKMNNRDTPDIEAKKAWKIFGADMKDWKD